MNIVTKQGLIATIAERWLDNYYGRGRWLYGSATFDPEAIYHRLKALPATASEAAVTAITGQPWWTANICHECGLDSDVTVGFGQEPHHPLDVKYLCPTCLERGLALVLRHPSLNPQLQSAAKPGMIREQPDRFPKQATWTQSRQGGTI